MKNQMMKTLITIGLTTTLTVTAYIAPLGQIAFADLSIPSPSFTDMTTHWSRAYVSPLTEKGIISGYGDNTFKPDKTLKRIEFIVLALKALESEQVITLDTNVGTGDYWGMPYITKAHDLNLLENDLTDAEAFEVNITREEMASIIIKAYEAMGEDTTLSDNLTAKTQSMIGDLMNVSQTYKSEVTKAYALNFIAGYGDKSFKPLGNATRGEASVVISKLLDETLRTPIEADEVVIDESETTDGTAEDYTAWLDDVATLSEDYKKTYLADEFYISTYNAKGELTIVDSGAFGYGDTTVIDDYTPDLNKRLANLIDYMIKSEHLVNLYSTKSTLDVDTNMRGEVLFASFSDVMYAPTNNFQFKIYNDYSIDYETYKPSKTEKGATIMLSLNRMYDSETNDAEFIELGYDLRHMTWLKESIVAFFGEEYGYDIAEWVQETHSEYALATRNFYEHYNEVTTIGNIDMVVPLISKDSPSTTILFTVH